MPSSSKKAYNLTSYFKIQSCSLLETARDVFGAVSLVSDGGHAFLLYRFDFLDFLTIDPMLFLQHNGHARSQYTNKNKTTMIIIKMQLCSGRIKFTRDNKYRWIIKM